MNWNNSIGDEKTMGNGPSGHAYALKPSDALGQYRILGTLRRGGMGEGGHRTDDLWTWMNTRKAQ